MERLLLVEDNTAFAEMVARALEHARPSWVVTRHGSAASALVEARTTRFSLALVDLGLPDRPGVELIAALAALEPPTRAMAFTVFDDRERVFEAVEAGAVGYVLKEEPVTRVVAQLEECLAGGMPVSSRVARHLFERCRRASPAVAANVTPRENDVLDCLERGMTYAEAASALGVGIGTIQSHVKHIYHKLDARTKDEALARAGRCREPRVRAWMNGRPQPR